MRLSWTGIHAWLEMYRYTAIGIAGKYFYLCLLVAPLWLGALWALETIGILSPFSPINAQNLVMGMPMVLIGALLGLRIIASEISGRSLEIVYTVPGGCERVWWTKLTAALLIMLPTVGLLAVGSWFFLTKFSFVSVHGAIQIGIFFMVLAMGLAALFRSEVGGAVATVLVLFFFILVGGFGSQEVVISPFYNPFGVREADAQELIADTFQNRIAYILVSLAIVGLAFMRSNRRERLLSG